MQAFLTKSFRFSASHALGGKIYGHNYVLNLTLAALSLKHEIELEEKVHRALISHLESRDLGMDVDFLKGIEITDESLLKAFWPRLESAISPYKLVGLSLDRDSRTRTEIGRHLS